MDYLFGFPAISFLTLDCHYALFGVGQLQALTKSRNITSILSMSTILAVARIPGVGISPDAWHSPPNSAQDWCCSV